MTWLPKPWGSLSNPNALGLRSSEPYSFRVIEKPFRVFLSVLALSDKTLTTLSRRFNGLLPPRKPCPFLQPEGLVRVGACCSLELSDLSGSPSANAHVGGFSTPTFPFRPCGTPILRFGRPMNHRVFKRRQLGCSPLTGADLSGLPDLDGSPAP